MRFKLDIAWMLWRSFQSFGLTHCLTCVLLDDPRAGQLPLAARGARVGLVALVWLEAGRGLVGIRSVWSVVGRVGFKLVLDEKQTLPAPHTDSTHLWKGLGQGAWLAVHEVNPSGAALPEDPHTGEQILLKWEVWHYHTTVSLRVFTRQPTRTNFRFFLNWSQFYHLSCVLYPIYDDIWMFKCPFQFGQ